MMEETISYGLNFTNVLALIFITLKLTGNITWSWWWVLSPLWLPIATFVGLLLIAVVVTWILE